MFGGQKKVGSSITFSYIVYSKKNMNKYIKQLKKAKISSLRELEESESEDQSKRIFFKYLKALSSRATIILVKFNKPQLKTILSSEKFKIRQADTLNKAIEQQIEEQKRSSQMLLGENEFFFKHLILLETRLAKNIPNYDFSKMKADEKIVVFESVVE